MDKQCEELIYFAIEKIRKLIDYMVKAREAKRANGHSVQADITMFQNPNEQMDILAENTVLLKETLEKIEQLTGNLNLVTKNCPEEEHSPAMQLPTSGL